MAKAPIIMSKKMANDLWSRVHSLREQSLYPKDAADAARLDEEITRTIKMISEMNRTEKRTNAVFKAEGGQIGSWDPNDPWAGDPKGPSLSDLSKLLKHVRHGFDTQTSTLDEAGNLLSPFRMRKDVPSFNLFGLELPGIQIGGSQMPGIIDDTKALPTIPAMIPGVRDHYETPEFATEAASKVEALEEALRRANMIGKPETLSQEVAEMLGVMLGQIPVGGLGLYSKGAGLLSKGAEYIPDIARKAGKVFDPLVEWFAPTIDPKLQNYLGGAAAGTALVNVLPDEESAIRDMVQQEVEAGNIPGGMAEDLVRQMLEEERILRTPNPEITMSESKKSKRGEPKVKKAKGGRAKPPIDKLALREHLANLMRDASVEGTGQELVPFKPTLEDQVQAFVDSLNPVTPGTRSSLEEKLLRPDNDVDRAVRASMRGEEPGKPNPLESLAETPVSRRTVLQGIAGAMSPIDVSPMAALEDIAQSVAAPAKAAIQKVQVTPTQLASILTEEWRNIFHGSYEEAVLDAADRFDQIEGLEGLAENLRAWYKDLEGHPGWDDPAEGDKFLEDLNAKYDLEEKFQTLARERGLLVDPLGEWAEHGDMEFVEPPLSGMKPRVQELVELIRAGETKLDPKNAEGLQKWLDSLGEETDTVFAGHFLPGYPDHRLSFDELQKFGVDDETILDYFDDMLEGSDLPFMEMSWWAEQPPELRQEFLDIQHQLREMRKADSGTPGLSNPKEWNRLQKRLKLIEEEIRGDTE